MRLQDRLQELADGRRGRYDSERQADALECASSPIQSCRGLAQLAHGPQDEYSEERVTFVQGNSPLCQPLQDFFGTELIELPVGADTNGLQGHGYVVQGTKTAATRGRHDVARRLLDEAPPAPRAEKRHERQHSAEQLSPPLDQFHLGSFQLLVAYGSQKCSAAPLPSTTSTLFASCRGSAVGLAP